MKLIENNYHDKDFEDKSGESHMRANDCVLTAWLQWRNQASTKEHYSEEELKLINIYLNNEIRGKTYKIPYGPLYNKMVQNKHLDKKTKKLDLSFLHAKIAPRDAYLAQQEQIDSDLAMALSLSDKNYL